MSIIRTKKAAQTPYVMLDTTAMNDERLSYRARGLHTYLMSKPDGWQIYLLHLEQRSPTEGREAIRNAIKELERTGYAHREKVRDERGRLAGWRTTIYETPQLRQDGPEEAADAPLSPTTGLPTSVLPTSVNPQLVSIDLRSKALNKEFPPTPTSGGAKNFTQEGREQNTAPMGDKDVSSGEDSAVSPVPYSPLDDPRPEPAPDLIRGQAPVRRGLRASGDAPRQRAMRAAKAMRELKQHVRERCPYCDTYGLVPLLQPDGTPTNLRCVHERDHIEAYVARNGLTWPHARPPSHQGGPAP